VKLLITAFSPIASQTPDTYYTLSGAYEVSGGAPSDGF
jgi:hypothetical protein